MSEIEREDILAQRLEEKQQLLDKRLLSQMVQQQRGAGEESVAKAAKRKGDRFRRWAPVETISQANTPQEVRQRRRPISSLNSRRSERPRTRGREYVLLTQSVINDN
jgi:RNA polymerase-associated protein RTF1